MSTKNNQSVIDRIERVIQELGDSATFERVCQETHAKKKSVSITEIRQVIFYALAEKRLHFQTLRNLVTVLYVTNYQNPVIVTWRGWTAVLVPSAFTTGWTSITVISDGEIQKNGWSHMDYKDRASAINAVVLHFAEQAYQNEDSDDFPESLLKLVAEHDRKSLLSDWAGWLKFQRRYRQAREFGLDDGWAHNFASSNPAFVRSTDDTVNLNTMLDMQNSHKR